MTENTPPGTGSMKKTLAIALAVAVLGGAGAGFVAGSMAGNAAPHASTYAPVLREFWVFTVVLPFNESAPGLPSHDYFAPDTMSVCKGDRISIHFFNTEEAAENHTFTMVAPYEMNHIVPAGTTTDHAFNATTTGSYAYRCTYHQPTMTGWLTVRDC
jgi:plastocyanin